MPARPQIELLWWEGCPSTDHARELVRTALDELGAESVEIRMVEITTDAEASERGFRGSPTILVNGVDLVEFAGGAGAGTGTAAGARGAGGERPDDDGGAELSCRLYHRRDGRISPTPDPADVRAALTQALAGDAPPVAEEVL